MRAASTLPPAPSADKPHVTYPHSFEGQPSLTPSQVVKVVSGAHSSYQGTPGQRWQDRESGSIPQAEGGLIKTMTGGGVRFSLPLRGPVRACWVKGVQHGLPSPPLVRVSMAVAGSFSVTPTASAYHGVPHRKAQGRPPE